MIHNILFWWFTMTDVFNIMYCFKDFKIHDMLRKNTSARLDDLATSTAADSKPVIFGTSNLPALSKSLNKYR